MHKFKVGDKVKVIRGNAQQTLDNRIGEICYAHDAFYYLVYFKGWLYGHAGLADGTDKNAMIVNFFRKKGIPYPSKSLYFLPYEVLELVSSQMEFNFDE